MIQEKKMVRRKLIINTLNPSTKEAFDRQELLEEAKKKYPVGTRFKSAASF